MAPGMGRFSGKKGQVFDKYGANHAAAALPGQGWRVLHNQLQSPVQAMMKLGRIISEQEVVNFIFDRVGDPYISRYVNRVISTSNSNRAQHDILPDLHTCNFPVGR